MWVALGRDRAGGNSGRPSGPHTVSLTRRWDAPNFRPAGRKFGASERRMGQTGCGLLWDETGRPELRGVRAAREVNGVWAAFGCDRPALGLGALPSQVNRRCIRVSKDLTNAGAMRINVSIAEVETDPISW